MSSCSKNDLAQFREAFQLFNSRGKILISQIAEALRSQGHNPTDSVVKKFTCQYKPDERISFEVFLPICQAISEAKTNKTPNDFIEGLSYLDREGNGFISSAEIRYLLTSVGDKMTEEDVEQLLSGQEDSQGNVNYEKFVKLVMYG